MKKLIFVITLFTSLVLGTANAQFIYDFNALNFSPNTSVIPGVATASDIFAFSSISQGFLASGNPARSLEIETNLTTSPSFSDSAFVFTITPDPTCPTCVIDSITFDVSTNYYDFIPQPPGQLAVAILNDQFLPAPIAPIGVTPGYPWGTFEKINVPLGFTLTAPTTFSLSFFANLIGPSTSISIDNLIVDVICIPEPSQYVALALAALFIACVAARRFRKKALSK